MAKRMLTSKEAADYLSIKEGTLRNWRHTKRYKIKHVTVGVRKIMYQQTDLDKFLEKK